MVGGPKRDYSGQSIPAEFLSKRNICGVDDNREILTNVDAKVLEAGARAAVARVGHREPLLLALLLAGEVGQLVQQVVR